jgi:hypothetical protein
MQDAVQPLKRHQRSGCGVTHDAHHKREVQLRRTNKYTRRFWAADVPVVETDAAPRAKKVKAKQHYMRFCVLPICFCLSL